MLTHIVISPEPLVGDEDRTAICGAIIKDPLKVWTAENPGQTVKELFSALLNCSRCWRAEWGDGYCYGMVSGAEVRKREISRLNHAQNDGGQGPGEV